MIYLNPQSTPITQENWGYLLSPKKKGIPATHGRLWAVDNGAFAGFEAARFFAFLDAIAPDDRCLFVVCPDVVGNALQTMQLYKRYAGEIHLRGYPVAFVAQDGQENYRLPEDYDALFIGGSTDWKMSPAVDRLILQAQQAGRWVHVGRVNSQKRIRHFQLVGVDSVDGTAPIYAPSVNIPRLDAQLNQRPLFTMEA